jgi:hypothetical protein
MFFCGCATEHSDADVEDNVEQDMESKVHVTDMGESGYSSEKAGSAVESSVPHLSIGDSSLASPVSSADMSGAMSQLCNRVVMEVSKELVVTIPVSTVESVGSPLSPSPVSSEVNLDCSSLIPTHAHRACMFPDCNRPVSRFAFRHDDYMDSGEGVAGLSPVEDDSGGVKNTLDSDLCEDISKLCTNFVQATEPNMNGCEEKQHVCGGGVGSIVEEVELEVGNIDKGDTTSKVISSGIATSVVHLSEKITHEAESTVEAASKMQSNKEVADMLSSGMMASKVQSTGLVASWSATLLPRYQCDDGECSIQSCLNQFTALELMTGNNKVGCEVCTQRQNHGKSN